MSYQGHHPVESGLQNHSVGGAYPLILITIQSPTPEVFGVGAQHTDRFGCIHLVQNVKTGKVAAYMPGEGNTVHSITGRPSDEPCPRIFTSLSDCNTYLDALARGVEQCEHWVDEPRRKLN